MKIFFLNKINDVENVHMTPRTQKRLVSQKHSRQKVTTVTELVNHIVLFLYVLQYIKSTYKR